jgi:DNA-binding NtrC family response regulator
MDKPEYSSVGKDGIRLLLVDDDVNLLELTSQLLFRKGYFITPATEGSEAMAILNNNHSAYDIVVTDLCMPGINGVELAEMIKDLSPDIPVILHTAKIDLVDDAQIARAGILEVISKPYRVEDLDKIIRKVIKENKGMNQVLT